MMILSWFFEGGGKHLEWIYCSDLISLVRLVDLDASLLSLGVYYSTYLPK